MYIFEKGKTCFECLEGPDEVHPAFYFYVSERLEDMDKMGKDYIDFYGNNCEDCIFTEDEPCKGWNGWSRRCYCKNRRVDWEYDKGVRGLRAKAW